MNKKWEEEFDDIEKYIIKHVKEKPSLALELIKASEKIDKEIYKVRLAKQRTQLLARVREAVGKEEPYTQYAKIPHKVLTVFDSVIDQTTFGRNQLRKEILKKLEIISEEVK